MSDRIVAAEVLLTSPGRNYLALGDDPGFGGGFGFDEVRAAQLPHEPVPLPVTRRRGGSMTDW